MDHVWAQVQGSLRDKLGYQSYEIWIRPIRVAAMGQEVVQLEVPNRYFRDWVQANYGATLCEALNSALGRTITVHFGLAEELPPAAQRNRARHASGGRAGAQPVTSALSDAGAAPAAGPAPAGSTPADTTSADTTSAGTTSAGTRAGGEPGSARTAPDDAVPNRTNGHSQPLALLHGADPNAPRSGLSSDKTFDAFVVGGCNQFAHACARASADRPGSNEYNPLFIYGGTGMGKTHLLHAIGNHIQRKDPSARVLYVSAEEFTNELIDSLRYNRMVEFRAKFRNHPTVLLIDDVQFVGGKDRTQEELFHTFEELRKLGRQIVFTSDVLPREIRGFEPRLRTRCESGMLADMQPPDLETLVAILHQKGEALGVPVPSDLAQYIGSRVRGSIRELEGVLNRLKALCRLHAEAPTLTFARKHLASVLPEESRVATPDEIIQSVASFYNIKVGDLRGTRRLKRLVRPRHVAMWLVRKHTELSFPEIGRAFDRDHATVQHACKKISRELQKDVDLRNALDALARAITR